MNATFFVYILASKKNGTLYVGVTNDLARRLADTKPSSFLVLPKDTRSTGWSISRRSIPYSKRAREHALKRWRRAWKISLIESLNPDWRDLSHQLNA